MNYVLKKQNMAEHGLRSTGMQKVLSPCMLSSAVVLCNWKVPGLPLSSQDGFDKFVQASYK